MKWSPTALQHLSFWQQTDPKKYAKILKLCEQICLTPTIGIGKPEPLKYEFSGYWSRRIDRYNRLVYCFDDDTVIIAQAYAHYQQLPGVSSVISSNRDENSEE